MKAIILAAGKGKRMQSDLQKVMHPILGKPIVQYVAEAAKEAGFADITVVVGGEGGEEIKKGLSLCGGLSFAVQQTPLGTGDAVKAGAGSIKPDDDVIVLCGDMPLVTADFLKEMMEYKKSNPCEAVVAAVFRGEEMGDFGRVFDRGGEFVEIVEARDITDDHPATNWGNTGIYLFQGSSLLSSLEKIKNTNSQNEYYLTDVPKILREEGKTVRVFHTRADMSVFTGINTQSHLAEAVSHMRERINERHMANGVRMLDPRSAFIEPTVKIARGVTIYPNVMLEGDCEIANGATIGMCCHIVDTKIGSGTTIGPFAHLRQGTVIGENCRVGNFVEVKNATLADDVKAAHLAYIGDADVGKNVNYSCGAITANYDGKNKHRTVIGENAFIGSNANLIAPVEIGENAFIAAGSTITSDIPPYALGIARERQCIKENWTKK
ncbi:MAG: bifunctional UDP-N-acetylglucosamine diphosphorylase/glucosamine-1-phosphate N-acetyltransferase GlmU [Defluviitaleaceae bacterium]|nr:bifunctional UDP-N-acetylglucosamine diphosphorylase/glucosamine-1-phosphate N-acetyltransferase GlmU [Defluviitaleaceae bacterium]